jgi:hypothetical protein
MKAGTGEITNENIKSEEELLQCEESLNLIQPETKFPIENNSPNDSYLHELKKSIKFYNFVLACLSTFLDGFVLIFLGYNNSIISKEHKWQDNSVAILDIIFHIVSALGAILSIYTTKTSTYNGLLFSLYFSYAAFVGSLFLFEVRNFYVYSAIFIIICISNGHIQNICTTKIVKNFSSHTRPFFYVLAYNFTQFGKFLFSCIILKYNDTILKGDINTTVYPIILILFLQILINLVLTAEKRKKKLYLINQENKFPNLNHTQVNGVLDYFYKVFIFYLPSFSINTNTDSNQNNSWFSDLINVFKVPIIDLFNNYTSHILNLIFLNISLGIQFFSIINVFPLFNNKNYTIVDEIFYSKMLHTLFVLPLPIIFLLKIMTRKFLLSITFWFSLFFNILILFNILDSSILIHLFRWVWNICFITINLYCAESIPNKLRGINTSLMYLIFKISCIIEILTIDRFISLSIYVPIFMNILIIIGDLLLISQLKVETHMKTSEEINSEISFLESSY